MSSGGRDATLSLVCVQKREYFFLYALHSPTLSPHPIPPAHTSPATPSAHVRSLLRRPAQQG